MKPQQKEWISIESTRKIEERKRKKAAVNNSRTRGERARAEEIHTEANKEVKRSIRNDRRNYIEDLVREAEEAAASRNMKQLYDTTKKLCGKFRQGDRPVKDKDGNTLKSTEQQLVRWAEHFKELLNRPPPNEPREIHEAENDLDINCDRPSKVDAVHLCHSPHLYSYYWSILEPHQL